MTDGELAGVSRCLCGVEWKAKAGMMGGMDRCIPIVPRRDLAVYSVRMIDGIKQWARRMLSRIRCNGTRENGQTTAG